LVTDISVICLTAVLRLAVAVFISLDFQTVWPKKTTNTIKTWGSKCCKKRNSVDEERG